jgi:hypothetical protein
MVRQECLTYIKYNFLFNGLNRLHRNFKYNKITTETSLRLKENRDKLRHSFFRLKSKAIKAGAETSNTPITQIFLI